MRHERDYSQALSSLAVQVQGGGEKAASSDKLKHVACPLICLGGRDDVMPLDTRACEIRGWPLQNVFELPLGMDHRKSQSKRSWWLSIETDLLHLSRKSKGAPFCGAPLWFGDWFLVRRL